MSQSTTVYDLRKVTKLNLLGKNPFIQTAVKRQLTVERKDGQAFGLLTSEDGILIMKFVLQKVTEDFLFFQSMNTELQIQLSTNTATSDLGYGALRITGEDNDYASYIVIHIQCDGEPISIDEDATKELVYQLTHPVATVSSKLPNTKILLHVTIEGSKYRETFRINSSVTAISLLDHFRLCQNEWGVYLENDEDEPIIGPISSYVSESEHNIYCKIKERRY